jgi:hypothetical protein
MYIITHIGIAEPYANLEGMRRPPLEGPTTGWGDRLGLRQAVTAAGPAPVIQF